jgi:glycosyltransferase involved in cell wall biosynthesis
MRKVLIIHNKYRFRGGEDIAVENEISLLRNSYTVEEIFFENTVTNFFSQFVSFLTNKNKKSMRLVSSYIDIFNPDVVYIHNTWFKASNGIYKEIKSKNIPIVVKLHNFRFNCTKSFVSKKHVEKGGTCNACGYISKNRIFNKYFVNSYLKSFLVNYYGIKYFKTLKDSDFKILVLTVFQKEFLCNLGFDRNRIFILPNYLNAKNKQTNVNNKENNLIYAGRISKEKGVEELITCFLKSNLIDFTLKIFGNGPDLALLKEKYTNNRIKFFGEINNLEILEEIRKSSCVVTATKLFEGQPTLLCEASMLGIPSVFPDTGGISEFFPVNYNLSFKQYDYQDLTEKMNMLLLPEHTKLVGKKNKEFLNKYLEKNKLLNNFESMFIS